MPIILGRLARLGALALLAVPLALWAQATTPKLQLAGYEQALRLMEQGQCNRAKEMLLPGGRAQPGDEVALADIGGC